MTKDELFEHHPFDRIGRSTRVGNDILERLYDPRIAKNIRLTDDGSKAARQQHPPDPRRVAFSPRRKLGDQRAARRCGWGYILGRWRCCVRPSAVASVGGDVVLSRGLGSSSRRIAKRKVFPLYDSPRLLSSNVRSSVDHYGLRAY